VKTKPASRNEETGLAGNSEYDPDAVSVHYIAAEILIDESGRRDSIEAARECVSTTIAEALLAVADELHEIRNLLVRRIENEP
jgi:hypothetical protein